MGDQGTSENQRKSTAAPWHLDRQQSHNAERQSSQRTTEHLHNVKGDSHATPLHDARPRICETERTPIVQAVFYCGRMNDHESRHIITSDGVITTQPERTDLPLVVMPVVISSMIDSFVENLPLLHNIARVRMYQDFTMDESTIIKRTADADAVMVVGFHIADAILEAFHGHVGCLAFSGTGVASYVDMPRTRQYGIRVCNVVHYGDHAVAEHTFALLLELARHVGDLNDQMKTGAWDGSDGFALHGKTLGLVGFGGIGQTVARIATGFGMRVLVWNSHLDEHKAHDIGARPVDQIGDLFEQSDIVSLHLPLLDATTGIITAKELTRLQPGTLFVNTARAEIIEQGALTERLLQGDIPAALDVFEHEPLPIDDPLRTVPGIILTPHVAWRNDESYISMTRQMVQSIASYFQGSSLNVVD